MTSDTFQNLLESIREAKQILRGQQKAAREFVVEIPPTQTQPLTSYAICVQTDDPSLLVPLKIYEAIYSQSGLVRIVDESGGASLYPKEFFLPVAFPKEVEQVLAQAAA